MKPFLGTSLAVLLALVVGFVGLRLLHAVEAWDAEKATVLLDLRNTEQMNSDSQRDLAGKYAPDAADSAATADKKKEWATLERGALETYAARLTDQKQNLVNLYRGKPLPLSGEEKRQVVQWNQDVASYKAAHPETAAVTAP